MVKLLVEFVPRAAAALDHAVVVGGRSANDTVNRAVQFYVQLVDHEPQGGKFTYDDGRGHTIEVRVRQVKRRGWRR